MASKPVKIEWHIRGQIPPSTFIDPKNRSFSLQDQVEDVSTEVLDGKSQERYEAKAVKMRYPSTRYVGAKEQDPTPDVVLGRVEPFRPHYLGRKALTPEVHEAVKGDRPQASIDQEEGTD